MLFSVHKRSLTVFGLCYIFRVVHAHLTHIIEIPFTATYSKLNKPQYSLQGRAKQLYTCGFKTLSLVANADPDDIVKSVKQIPRKVAKQIVSSAKVLSVWHYNVQKEMADNFVLSQCLVIHYLMREHPYLGINKELPSKHFYIQVFCFKIHFQGAAVV